MQLLKGIVKAIDKLINVIGKVVGIILIIPLIGATVYDVILRYFFDTATIWAYDITWMFYAVFFLIGLSYCMQKDGHVRVDSFYGKIPDRKRAYLECIYFILFIFPVIIIILQYSIPWAWKAWLSHDRSQYTLWRPYVAPVKSFLPIAFALLGLQSISVFIKKLVFAIKGVEL